MTWRIWIAVAVHAAWFLVAAKFHGRSLRLERELRGFTEVDFRARSQNPAWVEALWRADRVRFWSTATALAALIVGYVVVADARGWPRPFAEEPSWAAAALAGFFWSMTGAFLANGAQSAARFSRDADEASLPGPGGDRTLWVRRAKREGALYWAAAAALGVVAVVMATF